MNFEKLFKQTREALERFVAELPDEEIKRLKEKYKSENNNIKNEVENEK